MGYKKISQLKGKGVGRMRKVVDSKALSMSLIAGFLMTYLH